MTKSSVASVLSWFLVTSAAPYALAGDYVAPKISAIAAGSAGEVYVRFDGLPNPSPAPCNGQNNNWVAIPAGNDALRALAFSIYFSGKPVQVETRGACMGPYEQINAIYSPTG